MSKCAVDDCERASRAVGFCKMHYKLFRRNGEPRHRRTLAERFDEFWIEQAGPLATPCHVWTGTKTNKGYGAVGSKDGNNIRAHRYAWERVHGPVPSGLGVRHKCDVPTCVNPDHLELGTQIDNIRDRVDRNRNASVKGSRNPSAKLNETDVERIRDILKAGESQKDVAKYFNVSHSLINAISKGRLWRAQV